MLSKCAPIESLSFVADMPNLRSISFVNTNVLDGDLHYLEKLDYAGFDSKRHYTHKMDLDLEGYKLWKRNPLEIVVERKYDNDYLGFNQ
jgi:hypothetical protein